MAIPYGVLVLLFNRNGAFVWDLLRRIPHGMIQMYCCAFVMETETHFSRSIRLVNQEIGIRNDSLEQQIVNDSITKFNTASVGSFDATSCSSRNQRFAALHECCSCRSCSQSRNFTHKEHSHRICHQDPIINKDSTDTNLSKMVTSFKLMMAFVVMHPTNAVRYKDIDSCAFALRQPQEREDTLRAEMAAKAGVRADIKRLEERERNELAKYHSFVQDQERGRCILQPAEDTLTCIVQMISQSREEPREEQTVEELRLRRQEWCRAQLRSLQNQEQIDCPLQRADDILAGMFEIGIQSCEEVEEGTVNEEPHN